MISPRNSDALPAQPRWPLVLIAALAAVLIFAGSVPASTDNSNAGERPKILRDVGVDQRLNEQVPLDLTFRDEDGKSVQLGQYFGKKPVVLSLVYFGCPMLCTMVENGLLQSLKQLKFDVGEEFDVVTVSFDPRDTPEVAAAKKALYVGLYGRPGAAKGWHFLTGDQASIARLTKAVGFRYVYDPETNQFAHATAIMVLTPEGRLARYFYGIQYPAGGLRLGLVEASENKIGSPVDAVLLFCSQYHPSTGKYGLVISRVISIAAGMTVLILGTLLIVLFRAGPRTNV